MYEFIYFMYFFYIRMQSAYSFYDVTIIKSMAHECVKIEY